jgi:hypothetical protein
MFPDNSMKRTTTGSPNDPGNVPVVGAADCPYCGNTIHLSKAAAEGPSIKSKSNTAAKMPMDQLKNVISAERGE